MTADPVLKLAARLLAKHRLDAVLIGNAAAALMGSPVTTLDLDFMFRSTPSNLRKLRRMADGLQLDFMGKIDGIRSFESLRGRAMRVRFGNHELLVASLADIIRSKTAANRPQDRAVLPILRRTLREAE